MPAASDLKPFTADLRAEFPEASFEGTASRPANRCRLRWATVNGERRIQLCGQLQRHYKGYLRTLEARTGMAAWKEARLVLQDLISGTPGKAPLHMAVGALSRAKREAYRVIETRPTREATKEASVREVNRLVAFLVERDLELGVDALNLAIRDTDPTTRARRSRCEAAVLLARCGGLNYQLPEGSKPRGLKPKTRKPITTEEVVEFCEGPLLRLGDEEAIWLYRCVAVLGIRANDCFALSLPSGLIDAGTPIPAWCAKKGCRFTATPSLMGKWDEWDLSDRPGFRLPSDRPATNGQIEEVNDRVRRATRRLRTALKDEASHYGFRALRHAAGARLLEMGVHSLRVAELLATSEVQLQRTYADFFKAGAANEVARLIGAQTVPSS